MVCAWDVLSGKADTGKEVVVIGGGAVGLETALFLARKGTIDAETLYFLLFNQAESFETLSGLLYRGIKKVTVVEMLEKSGPGYRNQHPLDHPPGPLPPGREDPDEHQGHER